MNQVGNTTQLCYGCNIQRPLFEFYTLKRSTTGYWSKCKYCHRLAIEESKKRKRAEEEKTIEYKKQRVINENTETINRYRAENNRLLQEVNFLTAVVSKNTQRLEVIERHLSILNVDNPFNEPTDDTVLCYSTDHTTESETDEFDNIVITRYY